jgi:hypothetical protein
MRSLPQRQAARKQYLAAPHECADAPSCRGRRKPYWYCGLYASHRPNDPPTPKPQHKLLLINNLQRY